jgi:hypothetical protein
MTKFSDTGHAQDGSDEPPKHAHFDRAEPSVRYDNNYHDDHDHASSASDEDMRPVEVRTYCPPKSIFLLSSKRTR